MLIFVLIRPPLPIIKVWRRPFVIPIYTHLFWLHFLNYDLPICPPLKPHRLTVKLNGNRHFQSFKTVFTFTNFSNLFAPFIYFLKLRLFVLNKSIFLFLYSIISTQVCGFNKTAKRYGDNNILFINNNFQNFFKEYKKCLLLKINYKLLVCILNQKQLFWKLENALKFTLHRIVFEMH